MFRAVIQDQQGPDVFVTSLTGECVRIYPMPVWLEIERKLSQMPGNHPSRLKFLDRVNYYGQAGELDAQGRVVIPPHLRDSASIVGDVACSDASTISKCGTTSGSSQKLQREPWTDDDGAAAVGARDLSVGSRSGRRAAVHEPVMVAEVLEHLAPARGGVFVDCTVGLGGHARALLEAGASRLIGLDRDPAALAQRARARCSAFGDRGRAGARRLPRPGDGARRARASTAVDGVLADLGVSSMQLDAPGRGFSFRRDEPLDMRMDTSSGRDGGRAARATSTSGRWRT